MLIEVVVVAVLSAPGSGRVWTHTERCSPGFEPELRRLLTIELKTQVVDAPAEGDSSVQIHCSADRYHVTLGAPFHEPSELEVDVTELAPLAIPRTVTLVVAEALTRLWRAPATSEPKPVVPDQPKADKPVVVEAPRPPTVEPRVSLSLIGVSRLAAVPLFGGGLALDLTVLPWLGVRIDAAVTRGSASRTAGLVTASLFDGSATVDVRLTRATWLLRGGIGMRAGYALLDGIPSNGFVRTGSVGGVLWGPQLGVGGAWSPLPWLSLGLGADGGVWAPRLEGTVIDEAPVRLDGLFASLWVSLGLRW